MDGIEKAVDSARKTLGSQEVDFGFFRKGWKEAKESERLSLLNHYKKQFVNTVLPRLEAKQRGFDTDFQSATQKSKGYLDKRYNVRSSMLQGKTLIMGDIVTHQKGALEEECTVSNQIKPKYGFQMNKADHIQTV